MLYSSFGEFSVRYSLEEDNFSIFKGSKCIFDGYIKELTYKDQKIYPSDFPTKNKSQMIHSNSRLTISYSREDKFVPYYSLTFAIDNKGVKLNFASNPECSAEICGHMYWGEDVNDTFPMSSLSYSNQIRCAVGPAASTADNMLFDRKTDSALSVVGGKSFRIKYDWEEKQFGYTILTGIKAGEHLIDISCVYNIMSNQYGIDYNPINKSGIFKKAPSGWMTWYSVTFDACEEAVIKNTKWQNENLKDYGADTIWVDWEWIHKDYTGTRDDGTNTFVPDPQKYPNGLGFVAEKIKEYGFTPALWIGFTNDPAENEESIKNPEIVLEKNTNWCGTYFYDFSHPKYLNEFLPKAVKTVRDWGYEALKYDTICDGIEKHELNHMKMYNPEMTTKEAFHNMVKRVRELAGEDVYLLACGPSDAGILWASDIFDAARIGADIFEWNEFIAQFVCPIMRYYPLHNIVLYNDPDNVILSEKYNTYNQAATRIYLVSTLGLPMTFGDVFEDLPKDRIDLIKRCLPVMDIHPMGIQNSVTDKRSLTVNLSIEKPYESYNVLNIVNLEKEKKVQEIRLSGDLYLDEGEYHLYDYTKDEYLGCVDTRFFVELDSCESRIVAVRKAKDCPQILSTSRHVTQGAAEIEDMAWDEDEKILKIKANLVKDDKYTITLYVPDDYKLSDSGIMSFEKGENGVFSYSFMPTENKCYEFELKF